MIKQLIAKLINKLKKKRLYECKYIESYGALLDKDDGRDWLLLAGQGEPDKLPSCVDLSQYVTQVKNQYGSNACVLFSLASCYEIMAQINNAPLKDLGVSEMFAWYETRKVRGWQNDNVGTFPRDACQVFIKGFSFDKVCQFIWNNWAKKPSMLSYWFRGLFKIKEYRRTPSINDVKVALNNKIPVSITLPMSLCTGIDEAQGYHQVTLIGYNDDTQQFKILNSWGNRWGDLGYFNLDYDKVDKYTQYSWIIYPEFMK